MNKDLFDFQDYKAYLQDWIASQSRRGHGVRSQMAAALKCQVAYVSQVLNKSAHLSLEQADALNSFLGHSHEEARFFLLLVQFARAGSESLRRHFREEIEQALQKRLVLRDRLSVRKTLESAQQATYYSAWYYAAVHVALSVEGLRTKESIARRLGLPVLLISSVLDFLVSVGLAAHDHGKFIIGETRLHLADDSPMIAKHHVNWRMRAIDSLDSAVESDLHYSSVITISRADILGLKSLSVKFIAEAKKLVRESGEEDVHCLNLDFFRLKG